MDRRQFMKNSGLLLMAVPWTASLQYQQHVSKQKVKIGVIGVGSRGRFLTLYLSALSNVEIIAICDDYKVNLEKVHKEIVPDARMYSDYKDLLDQRDIDAVVIATPLYLHHRMVLDSFIAGKHVFCEKAMGMNLSECKEMYYAYKASGKCFFVGQQRLFDPKYLKTMQLIKSGELGDVQRINCFWYRNHNWRHNVPSPELERKINWRMYREYSCGLMTELGGHQLQVGTWALQSLPKKIMGTGSVIYWKDGREVDDSLSVIYQFEKGQQMTYNSVISNKFYGLEEQILCSAGTIEPEKGLYYSETIKPAAGLLQMINDFEHSIFDHIPIAGTSWVPETAVKMKPEYLLSKEEKLAGISPNALKLVGSKHDGTPLLLQSFVNSVITGEQPENIAEECYYASVLALLGYQAIQEKNIIDFPDEAKIPYHY